MPKMRTTPVEFDFESIVRGVASDLALSSKEQLKKWPAASKRGFESGKIRSAQIRGLNLI